MLHGTVFSKRIPRDGAAILILALRERNFKGAGTETRIYAPTLKRNVLLRHKL